MKKSTLTILAALMAAFPLLAQPDAPLRMAVLDLKAPGNEGVVLSDRLYAEFIKSGLYDVVSREKRNIAVRELGISAADEIESMVKVGQKLKVDKIVGGSVGQIGDTWSLSLIAVDVASGKPDQHLTRSLKGKVDGLLPLADGFAKLVSADRAKQVKAVQAEKLALQRKSAALKARKAQLEKQREVNKDNLAKELASIDKKKDDLDGQHKIAGEKIAAHDKKVEEMKAAGKKPATDPAKSRALLEKKQQDILKKKEALDGDKEKARARTEASDLSLVKEIGLVEKAQWDTAQKLAAFEPKQPETEPVPAAVDTAKKAEPAKKPLRKAKPKPKASTSKPKAKPAD